MANFNTENIIPKKFEFIDAQIDILLKGLEIYAFNLNNTWGVEVDEDLQQLRKDMLCYTYQSLLSQKNNYRVGYDVVYNYELDKNRRKKYLYNKAKKNVA